MLGLGAVAANANEGGPAPNTWFTQLPGVIAQAPVQAPSAVAQQTNGVPTATFATSSHSSGTWLFPPHSDGGANN
jgi:hypothetical protein